MTAEYGRYSIEYARRSVPRDPRVTRTQALDEFAATLRTNQVHALAASRADWHMEGNVWLCLLLGAAYLAPADMVHSTDGIEAGWWVVKAKYYRLVQRSPRGYQLVVEERVLVVNPLIRLPTPINFEPLNARLSGRLNTNPIRILLDKEYYQIENVQHAGRLSYMINQSLL